MDFVDEGGAMTKDEAKKKASELHNWLQEAVGDVAYDVHPDDIEMYYEKTIASKFKRIKKSSGESNAKDWLADKLYNDASCVSDLIGDRLYDSAQDDQSRVMVAEELMKIGHGALKSACKSFISRRQKKV